MIPKEQPPLQDGVVRKPEDFDRCPRCGEPLEYDEVDVGVGVVRGNPGCPSCHWTPDAAAADDDTDVIIMVSCPQCGEGQQDLDGFGVLHCERCGYCTHASQHGDGTGFICDICGKRISTCRVCGGFGMVKGLDLRPLTCSTCEGTGNEVADDVRCIDCGLPYVEFPLDVSLPPEQWSAIHPQLNGVLCAQCIAHRAARIVGVTLLRMSMEF
jgi:hypothetical protein